MKYDFTTHLDRHGKDAAAIDLIGKEAWGIAPGGAKEGFDEIPMWVADMNFEVCPSITEALQKRIAHPVYGYFQYREEYYQSIIDWQMKYHGYTDLTRREIGYENGVHGCLCSALNVFTEPGDAVFLHVPAYAGFLSDLEDLGRKACTSRLVKDEQGIWRMNYEEMEEKLWESHAHFAIFCSPHNPTGRVWERWELEKAMEIFRKYDVLVFSDEIWADVVFSGQEHVPTSLVSDDARNRTITAYAPSKTFNLAGLVGSYHVIWNPMLRDKMERYSENTHYNEMNVLSMHALLGAYQPEGAAWAAECRQVLEENCRYAVDFIRDHFDGCEASMPQGTYMVFMDCENYCRRTGKTLDQVLRAGWDVGVAYQDGRRCADDWSIRINCALPLDRVQEAFNRLKTYVFVD